MTGAGKPARARWSIVFRTIAGTLGAYALTALVTVASSLVLVRLGMRRVEAVSAATLASFAAFAIIAMAVFHARSARRAWIWLLAGAVPATAIILLLRVTGG